VFRLPRQLILFRSVHSLLNLDGALQKQDAHYSKRNIGAQALPGASGVDKATGRRTFVRRPVRYKAGLP